MQPGEGQVQRADCQSKWLYESQNSFAQGLEKNSIYACISDNKVKRQDISKKKRRRTYLENKVTEVIFKVTSRHPAENVLSVLLPR